MRVHVIFCRFPFADTSRTSLFYHSFIGHLSPFDINRIGTISLDTMKIAVSLLLTLVPTVLADNHGPPAEAIVERMEYVDADGAELVGFLSMPENATADSPVPAIVIIP